MTVTYLDRILAAHRQRASVDTRDTDELLAEAMAADPPRGFSRRLRDTTGLAVIAEVKRRSPSKGDLAAGLDPAKLAGAYRDGGASCLSVLTDEDHFGGSPEDLQIARRSSGLPVLRKDFTVCAHDVLDARRMGADAVLLIAAALDDRELRAFHTLANEVGLDALVEIHDEAELERAVAIDAMLIGVNQRDLVTFEVDTDRAVRMAAQIPSDVVRVAESGVRGPEDAGHLFDAGYEAVLVGETLVRSPDPAAAVRQLRFASA